MYISSIIAMYPNSTQIEYFTFPYKIRKSYTDIRNVSDKHFSNPHFYAQFDTMNINRISVNSCTPSQYSKSMHLFFTKLRHRACSYDWYQKIALELQYSCFQFSLFFFPPRMFVYLHDNAHYDVLAQIFYVF